MPTEDALEGVEHLFELNGSVQNGEDAKAQRLGELSRMVPAGSGALNDDGGRRRWEAIEQLQEASTTLFSGIVLIRLSQWEGEIDHCDVDGDFPDELGCLLTRLGPPGADAHRLHQRRERLDPWFAPPAA